MNIENWERNVAFIRLDFPPAWRHTAQAIAVALAHFVGRTILRLRPEHTLGEILSWSESASLDAVEFVMALEKEFAHEIDDNLATHFEQRTFREFVEYLS